MRNPRLEKDRSRIGARFQLQMSTDEKLSK